MTSVSCRQTIYGDNQLSQHNPVCGKNWVLITPCSYWACRQKLVRYTISVAAMAGSGAVLGAKNTKPLPSEGSREPSGSIKKSSLKKHATYPNVPLVRPLKNTESLERLPMYWYSIAWLLTTRNFQGNFGAAQHRRKRWTRHAINEKQRAACTIGCTHIYKIDTDNESKSARIEYENLFALGLCVK